MATYNGSFNTRLTGTLADDATDIYTLTANAGGRLQFSFVHPDGAGTTGNPIKLTLFDPSGAEVFMDQVMGNYMLDTTIASAGNYELHIEDRDWRNEPAGTYALTTTLSAVAGTVYDGASNQTSATAIAAPIGAPIVGSLTDNDVDVFKLSTNAGGILKLDFTHPSGAGSSAPPIRLEIIDASSKHVIDSSHRGNNVGTTSLDKAGDYYVRISGGQSYATGDEGLYRLGTSFSTSPGTIYDGHANESAATAPVAASGQPIIGMLENQDTDYFAINTPMPGTLMVSFKHPAGAIATGDSITLSVIDGATTGDDNLFQKTERGNDLFSVDLPAAGTYYIKLQDGISYDGEGPGLYSLMAGMASNGGSTLRGTSGADHLVNTGGNDVIETGTGIDTVQYYGNASLYSITPSPAGASVTGNGGTDTLFNVERVAFDDRMVALDTEGIPAQAYRIYEAAFNRAPDLAGLGFWIRQMDAGLSLKAVAQSFIDSAEFRTRYGDAPSNRDMVTKFYQNILDRAPDQAGLEYWVDVLDRHLTDASGVLMGFSESPENVAHLIADMSHGIAYIPYA